VSGTRCCGVCLANAHGVPLRSQSAELRRDGDVITLFFRVRTLFRSVDLRCGDERHAARSEPIATARFVVAVVVHCAECDVHVHVRPCTRTRSSAMSLVRAALSAWHVCRRDACGSKHARAHRCALLSAQHRPLSQPGAHTHCERAGLA
jgi:hypothetical protein